MTPQALLARRLNAASSRLIRAASTASPARRTSSARPLPRKPETAPTRPSSEEASATAQQQQQQQPSPEAVRAAQARDAALRSARMNRVQKREEELKVAEDKKDKERRYNRAKRTYVSLMISVPVLLVMSYLLFNRLKPESGVWSKNTTNDEESTE